MPTYRALLACTLMFSVGEAGAQIRPPQKIGFKTGGFTGDLNDGDNFGNSIASMGDIDADGIPDLAVGAPYDDDGTVWILFMNADGMVRSYQKISKTEGGFKDLVGDFRFGLFLANGTDLDGDGRDELLLGGNDSVHTLFLNEDGTVRTQVVTLLPNLTTHLRPGTRFAVAGDLDDDGHVELLVGSPAGLMGAGDASVWTLTRDGTTPFKGINNPTTKGNDNYGTGLTDLGDLDNNGILDIAISAPGDDDGETDAGSVYIFLLERVPTGSSPRIQARSIQKISLLSGGLRADLRPGSRFGTSLSSLGDIDGDDVPDLVVGSPKHPGGGTSRGAAHVLFLNRDGTVKLDYTFEGGEDGSPLPLHDGDEFGTDVEVVGDYNNDGVPDVAVGAPYDDEGGHDRGAVWILFGLPEIPASVTIQEETPAQPTINEDITVHAFVKGVGEASNVNVNWRQGGDNDFTSTVMNADGGGQYSALIKHYAVSERGIEYFVSATTSTGSPSRSPADGWASIVVKVPNGIYGPVPGGTSANSYRLISVPIDLDKKGARTVFESSLGPYDSAVWR
ncbi:MAG: FG-GAP-like repeat-containing protein, partial [Rhodothermales bacterium]